MDRLARILTFDFRQILALAVAAAAVIVPFVV